MLLHDHVRRDHNATDDICLTIMLFFPKRNLIHLPRSFSLNDAGNQFSCDCRLAWMLYLENNTRSDKFRRELRHIKCDFDATDAGTTVKPGGGSSKVARLSLKQLGCREDYEHPRLRGPHTASPSPSFPAPGGHDYDDDDLESTTAGKLDDRMDKEGSTTDGDQDIVEGSLRPTVSLPASVTQGEGEAVGEDLSRSDHSSNNDIDTVLSQQKALDKSEPPHKNKPRPAGVNSAALHTSPASSCVGIMVTSLIALAISMDR